MEKDRSLPTLSYVRFIFTVLLCLASFNAHALDVLLAKIWNSKLDPSAYWVSEKLDGVRALWDGNQLRTRNGHLITPPSWYTEKFPKVAMDGELWMGRGQFEKISGIVNQQITEENAWQQVQYQIFELPNMAGDFSARLVEIQKIAHLADVKWLIPVPHFRVANAKELHHQFRAVLAKGGEGLMLHRADALYETGRSDVLLKLKPFADAEAIVVAHISGKGGNTGNLGALEVKNEAGLLFRIGSGLSKKERMNPPPIGSIITYRYTSLTRNGMPRFPRFLRIRPQE